MNWTGASAVVASRAQPPPRQRTPALGSVRPASRPKTTFGTAPRPENRRRTGADGVEYADVERGAAEATEAQLRAAVLRAALHEPVIRKREGRGRVPTVALARAILDTGVGTGIGSSPRPSQPQSIAPSAPWVASTWTALSETDLSLIHI